MITTCDNPFILHPQCQQTSCWFEKSLYSDENAQPYSIELPEKIKSAVPKRKIEFIAGRHCAITSLHMYNNPLNPEQPTSIIGINENRAPIWPAKFTGSITHSKGFASAIVAEQKIIRAIGIDSEFLITQKTAQNISSHILTTSETYGANTALMNNHREYLTLVFSAKESIFKCLNPLVNQYFDFRDAMIILDQNQPGEFEFELLKTLNKEFSKGYSGTGKYSINGDYIHTGIILPA